MTTIRAAVEALRTSREALPDQLQVPWEQGPLEGRAVVDRNGFVLFRPPFGEPMAAHIALVASPHVVQALEELLAAFDAFREPSGDLRDQIRRIDAAADAVAAAITRTEEAS